MARVEIKKGDTWPPVQAYLTDENGPVPLLGATVKFLMKQIDGVKAVSGTGVATDPTNLAANPNVQYTWRSDGTDTNVVGIYRGEFEITFAPGTASERKETFPSGEYIDVLIHEDLG